MNIQRRSNPMQAGAAARSGKRPDAFADPLEGAEWEGLGWSIPLVARMIAGPRMKNERKINDVQRFTDAGAARKVCVS